MMLLMQRNRRSDFEGREHYGVRYEMPRSRYSDLSEVAEKRGVDNEDFYADMAKSFWLCDKDAVEDKLAAYYENVVRH